MSWGTVIFAVAYIALVGFLGWMWVRERGRSKRLLADLVNTKLELEREKRSIDLENASPSRKVELFNQLAIELDGGGSE